METKRTLILKSKKSEMSKLEKFVDIISDDYNLNHTCFSNMIIALSELVENSIKYGNKFDEQKEIRIDFYYTEGKLNFEVSDEGEGFDYEKFYENHEIQLKDECIGLFTVSKLADEIEFLNGGRTVKIVFDLAKANQLLSLERVNVLKRAKKEQEKFNEETKNKRNNIQF